MSATAWPRDEGGRWLEPLWIAFVLANLAAMLTLPEQVPIPYHFIWISLTLVYGVRAWRLSKTLVMLGGVMLLSGLALFWAVAHHHADYEEYPEIGLMAMVFLGMVLHVQRRQAAAQEVNRLAEDRARLLEREHEFLRDASHQLRTPITVARGYAELIAQDCLTLAEATGSQQPQLQEDVQVLIDELDRLTHISDVLLLLAAAERPEFLKRSPVRVDDLVDEVTERWRSVASRRWTVHAGSGATVCGDRERLRAALDALVDNALAFTTDGDAISVLTIRSGGDVLVEVADTGPGLSPAIADKVFERFASDDRGRRSGRGTGLGLAGVQAVVVAHGGSVSAGNRPGSGACFRLRLPVLHARPTDDRTALPVTSGTLPAPSTTNS